MAASATALVADRNAGSMGDHFQGEDFASLLDETLGRDSGFDGSVVTGRVVRLTDEFAIVDVGLKSEGRVALKEFSPPGAKPEVKPGDYVELYVERYEDRDGSIVLSREKARREEAWTNLEKAFEGNQRVQGAIYGRVKGGFTVDLGGAVAFLPGSQVDIRPVRDVGPLMGSPQPFQILKMDRARGNIVVSRRAVLEETRAEQRSELIQGLKEGMILDGVVKNITDYGAFVDLGGVDGLLHVTDIAWRRINHPSEALQIGQQVKVQVIRFNPETQRISLGMKQLEADPWEGVAAKYPPGAKYTGRVTNITDYGAFVELEPGVEGLVHVSEMSWTKKNVHPGKIVATSQEVEVMVLDVDSSKRRISLGLKQVQRNPWEQFVDEHPIGSVVEGEIRNITEFGLFIGIAPDVDGMVHMSDLSWDEPGELAMAKYEKAQIVKAKVLDVDVEKERISLGIKQLRDDPAANVLELGPQERHRHLRRHRDPAERHRGEGQRRAHRLHPPCRARPRQVRPAPRPLRGGREGGRQDHCRGPRRPQARLDHQGQGGRGGQAGDPGLRQLRFRCLAGRHPRRGDPPAEPAGPVGELSRGEPIRSARPPMTLETDLLLDRRRLKRRLFVWRAVAVLGVLAAVLAWFGGSLLPTTGRHIARLTVSGIITEDRKLTEAVSALANDKNVDTLIVLINSPGGSVAGGESLHDAIGRVAARKPVVAVMGGTAASAGYMIALPAARIFAREATLTGSIGVLLQTGEVSGLLGKLGVTGEAITSGPLKDQPSFTRPLSPEGREVLHGLVMDMFDQFVAMVVAGRHLPEERVRELADGRAYTGRQALRLGLVDQIGGEADARQWLAAERHVPLSIPVRDVGSGETLAARAFGATLGPLFGDVGKMLVMQGLKIDGAWALWQADSR